jgi:hypothetical protein
VAALGRRSAGITRCRECSYLRAVRRQNYKLRLMCESGHEPDAPWGNDMPQVGNWRSQSAYDYLNELKPSELAWEFLRRNPDYKRDYRTAVEGAAGDDGISQPLILRWGLRFPFRSGSTGK